MPFHHQNPSNLFSLKLNFPLILKSSFVIVKIKDYLLRELVGFMGPIKLEIIIAAFFVTGFLKAFMIMSFLVNVSDGIFMEFLEVSIQLLLLKALKAELFLLGKAIFIIS